MKVRLIGINLESIPNAPGTSDAPTVASNKEALIARLASLEGELYCYFSIPAEEVPNSAIGDEFTIHLERVKK